VEETIQKLADKIKIYKPGIRFRALEIGALDLGGREKFYDVLKYFPGSDVIGFEVDETVCERMNASSETGITYYPHALGVRNESRIFYETNEPMCSSLYKPNEKLLKLFLNFEVAYLKNEIVIDTISLDFFLDNNSICDIDFMKIDVQGAELDIFKGAITALKDITFIVSEIEFIQHYENQPLFGDVCNFLEKHDFMFHKFLGIGGRSLKPVCQNNDLNFASQHIWSDAIFLRNILNIRNLPSSKLLKLSFLAALYGSIDVTVFALNHHDKIFKTDFVKVIYGTEFVGIYTNTSE
jgi:FkbM family methyltransferase